jgi:hypothetical protein
LWSDTLACIEALSLERGVDEPAWIYQQKLLDECMSDVETHDGIAYRQDTDLKAYIAEASNHKDPIHDRFKIDLPEFALAIRNDPRLETLFGTAGFRLDLARKSSKTGANS